MERMKQPDRRTLICHLVDGMREYDSWAGETHIQKCVLFLQDLVGVPMGYEFVLHLHGPFSFELRSELALMRARLQLDVEPHIGYGPSFTLAGCGKTLRSTQDSKWLADKRRHIAFSAPIALNELLHDGYR